MALTINPEITGQEISTACSYCYLYEPLRVQIIEDVSTATKLYIDMEIIDTTDSTNIIATEVEYGDYDINSGFSLSIDLMKLASQFHDANLFKYSSVSEIASGWQSVVSKYKYNFKIYTDETSTPTEICKLPIIGARNFQDFTPAVSNTQALTEADLLGVDLSSRWNLYPYIQQSLALADATDSTPTITNTNQTQGCNPDGFIVFKSRFGGWMTWGFDIRDESFSGSYSGNLEVGMFESTDIDGGNPFVPVDYTESKSKHSVSLKALSLPKEELRAMSGIHSSPAIYYLKDSSSYLELMKRGSASTPLLSTASGGDFELSLSSISNNKIKTR